MLLALLIADIGIDEAAFCHGFIKALIHIEQVDDAAKIEPVERDKAPKDSFFTEVYAVDGEGQHDCEGS